MLLDLVLPVHCGGCGAPGMRWCAGCAQMLAVGPDEPHLVTPRLDPGVPVFSLGRYTGPRRTAILALKEHGRADLVRPLGDALGAALAQLIGWGLLDHEPRRPLTLVPAPTRRTAARRRGGDPVTALARVSGLPVAPALRLRAGTRDSMGLSASERQRNITGRVVVRRTGGLLGPGPAVLVDDVVTTGATATEAVRTLLTGGLRVQAVLALAHA